MGNFLFDKSSLENAENAFTELFALLKRYDNSSNNSPLLNYDSCDLKIMNQHIENALDTIVQGLQGLGHLIGMVAPHEMCEASSQIGFFISIISNLTAALNDLREDTEYVLKTREVINY